MKRFLNVARACFMASLLIIPVFAVFNTAGIAGDVKLRDKYPPSWYQILPADKRFVLVMNDEAVLDKETGLVWQRSPALEKRIWRDAVLFAYNKIIGGRKGWRLPTIEEIETLIDPTQIGPALPAGHPFIIQPDISFFWTATTIYYSSYGNGVYSLQISDGSVLTQDKSYGNCFWCVRGGYGYNN